MEEKKNCCVVCGTETGLLRHNSEPRLCWYVLCTPDSLGFVLLVAACLLLLVWPAPAPPVIPHLYRQHFPLRMKSHSSHDVVLLCAVCHAQADVHNDRLRHGFTQLVSADGL